VIYAITQIFDIYIGSFGEEKKSQNCFESAAVIIFANILPTYYSEMFL